MDNRETPLEEIYLSAETIESALTNIDKSIALAAEDDDEVRDLAEALFALYAIKNHVKVIYEELEGLVAQRLRGEITLAGGATLEVKSGAPRKSWDHAGLAQEVARRIVDMAFDMDTGEMRMSFPELAAEILKYAAPSYWRVAQLNEIGVNADMYCEKGEYRQTVAIRRSEE